MDFSHLSSLERLWVNNNELNEIGLHNNKNIVVLDVSNNRLNFLDLSEQNKLDWLNISNNSLTSLKIRLGFSYLKCNGYEYNANIDEEMSSGSCK